MSAPPHADPGEGVFETTLVHHGRPVELDAHVERITASLLSFFGAALPSTTRGEVIDSASGLRWGRVRFTVLPDAGRLETRVAAEEIDPAAVFPGPDRAVLLRSHTVEGGLGEHKWADRRLLERAAAEMRADELPLLLDGDGSVLEASRGSVFCAGDGWLTTPPADGRILPGIARRQAIAVARAAGVEVREAKLTLDDLRRGEVFLAGSVRGIEPVRALEGIALPGASEVSELVAGGLRRRWLQTEQAEPVAVGAGGRRAGRPAR